MNDHVTFAALMDWLLFDQRPAFNVTTHVPNCRECICRFRLVQRITSYSEQKGFPPMPDSEPGIPRTRSV